MVSNQTLTLKGTIATALGTGGTFEVYETGLDLVKASIVFKNAVQLERMSVDINTAGLCTVVKRGLTNRDTKVEDAGLKKDWSNGAKGYVTVLASDLLDVDDESGTKVLSGDFSFTGEVIVKDLTIPVNGDFNNNGKSKPYPEFADETARDAFYTSPVNGNKATVNGNDCTYNGTTAQWEYFGISTPPANASNIASGVVKIANGTQIAGGLSTTPEFVLGVKDLVKTSSGATDENKVPVLDTNGQLAEGFLPTSVAPTQFTLGENMTALDIACLKTDGNIYKYKGLVDTAGVTYTTDTVATINRNIMVDTNTIVIAYVDDVNNDLHMKAGTIVDGVITFGAEITPDATLNFSLFSMCKVDTNAGCIFYQSSTTVWEATPFTVSGNTITLGTPSQINGATANLGSTTCDICSVNTNKVVFTYTAHASNVGTINLRCGTIAGNVLTLGTEITAITSLTAPATQPMLCKLDTDKALFAGIDNASDLCTNVLTMTGTTTITQSAQVKTAGTFARPSLYQVSTDLAMYVYDETDIKVRYISVSGTTATHQTATSIVASTVFPSINVRPLIQLNTNLYGVAQAANRITWFHTNPTTYVNRVLGTINYQLFIASSTFILGSFIPYGIGKFWAMDYTNKKVYLCNYDSRYIIGILQETGIVGQSKRVALPGQISNGHTSLSKGEKYYINYDGTYTLDNLALTESVSGQVSFLGKSISNTQIIVDIHYSSI